MLRFCWWYCCTELLLLLLLLLSLLLLGLVVTVVPVTELSPPSLDPDGDFLAGNISAAIFFFFFPFRVMIS